MSKAKKTTVGERIARIAHTSGATTEKDTAIRINAATKQKQRCVFLNQKIKELNAIAPELKENT